MPIVELSMRVHAPIARCFDLSRSIDLHRHSLASSAERAIAGVTTGLIGLNESVTWEARHFGIVQRLTSKITAFDRPRFFRDSMVSGAFERFDHDHFFEENDESDTVMRDVFDFDAPLGFLGRIAEVAFLSRYMKRLLAERNEVVKSVAESDEWQTFLPREAL